MNQAAPAPRLTLDDVAAMIQRGDLDGARAQCERYFAAVDAAALRAPFHFYLGVIEQRGGNLEAGIKHYELALAQNRRNPAWLRQAASAHFSAHSIERAEHLYREALRIDPCDALSHYNFGILLPNGGTEDYALDPQGSEIIAQWHNVPDSGEQWTTPPLALRTFKGRYVIERCWDDAAITTDSQMTSKGIFSRLMICFCWV